MKENRESRLGTIELRDDDGEQQISGYAAVFNQLSENLGGFREQIAPGAFDQVMGDDVRALFNHEPHLILGRTTADTLQLSLDDTGLRYRIDPPDTQYARDLIKSIERKDVTQSSFAFRVEDDSWDEDDDGRLIRTIRQFRRLYDISPVTYPAYPDTSVAARSCDAYRHTMTRRTLDRDKCRLYLISTRLTPAGISTTKKGTFTMSDELKRLQEKRAQIADKMAKMVEAAEKEDRGLTSDDRGQWDTMRQELEQLDQRIADLKEAEELRRSVEVPLNPLPAETREYELDDFGNPMVPKKKPKDQRADKEQQYTDAFMKLLRSDQPGMLDLNQAQRQALRDHYVKEEVRAQGTIPNSSGGYLIPTTLASRIIEVMKAYGGIRQYATVMNTTAGETINWPTNDDTGNEGELVAEHAQVDETELEFGQKDLGAYKYSSKVIRVSIELLQDSAFALDSFITRAFGIRLGRITAKHYATGTGNKQPQGLLPAAEVGHIASSPSDIGYRDLLRLKHSVDPAYRNMGGCRWVFNDSVLLQFKEMLDENGRPLWKPSMADGTPALLDGDPYVIDQGCPDPAADSIPMAYGDLSEFIIRELNYWFMLFHVVSHASYIPYKSVD